MIRLSQGLACIFFVSSALTQNSGFSMAQLSATSHDDSIKGDRQRRLESRAASGAAYEEAVDDTHHGLSVLRLSIDELFAYD